MAKAYAHLKEIGALPEGLDEFKHVQWATAIIWSRTFNVYPEKYDETEEVYEEEGSLEDELWDDGTWVDDIVDGDPEELDMLDADEAASGLKGGAEEEGATGEGGEGERAAKFKLELSPAKKWKRGSFLMDNVTNAYMLLPFLDMLNHDFANQAVWDMSGERVIMSASKRCGAGKPVYTSYGMKGNDDFFLYYGFLPDPNPYDSARLFSTRESFLQWYVDNYVSGGWEGGSADLTAPINKGFHYDAAVKVLDEAVEVSEAGNDLWRVWKAPAEGEELDTEAEEPWRDNVRKELGENEGTMFDLGPEYEFEEDNGFEVWPEQHVEPRLLAMLAALRYSHVKGAREEGDGSPMAPLEWEDFNEISTGALNVGRKIPGVSKCADQHPTFAPFFIFAAQAIQDRVRQLLASYPTTLSEDVRLLQCSGVDINYDEEDILPVQSCPWTNQTLSTRMKVIVKFRVLKKQLLVRAARRLQQDCEPWSLTTTAASL
eukprot:TRINITY_DN1929_c0_g1_i1.p1 TRINITY_DN1929_c0_g1~~TRINITY_DN1929_c0_g1_i1.p1  ORF type:complete len:570 (-),score=120.64 TRINITY_DN1929_c0_g1_i1:644-2104(-)